MTITFHHEQPDAAPAGELVPPKLINITRPSIGAPPKPIDNRLHYRSGAARFDVTGALVCLAGMVVIMYARRSH
ncbi:hypothetical protein OG729_01650 [Streptomyces sp. NBC_00210]|uniref:hypothetical protein n=2 Tax=unclassified Streptomyces TaxID=2593676 RepID=UPI00324CC29E